MPFIPGIFHFILEDLDYTKVKSFHCCGYLIVRRYCLPGWGYGSVVDPVFHMKMVQLRPQQRRQRHEVEGRKKGRGRRGRGGGGREEPLSDKFSHSGFWLTASLAGAHMTLLDCFACLPPSSLSVVWMLMKLSGKWTEVDQKPGGFWSGDYVEVLNTKNKINGYVLSYILRRCDSVTSFVQRLHSSPLLPGIPGYFC